MRTCGLHPREGRSLVVCVDEKGKTEEPGKKKGRPIRNRRKTNKKEDEDTGARNM